MKTETPGVIIRNRSFSVVRKILSRAVEFVVLLWKEAKRRNLSFSADNIQFLEIHFKTNVVIRQFNTSNLPKK